LEYKGASLANNDTMDTDQQSRHHKQEFALPVDMEPLHTASSDTPLDVNEAVNRMFDEPVESTEQTLAITPYM
jgi:hypothetical protein